MYDVMDEFPIMLEKEKFYKQLTKYPMRGDVTVIHNGAMARTNPTR